MKKTISVIIAYSLTFVFLAMGEAVCRIRSEVCWIGGKHHDDFAIEKKL